MNGFQIRKLNVFQSKSAFMKNNTTDFPPASPGGRTAAALDIVIALILQLAGVQTSGALRQTISIKDDNLERMIRLVKQINRAANSLADELDGIEDLFRLPRRRSEAIWLATARAYYRDSEPYEEEFQEIVTVPDFRAALLALISSVESAGTEADIAGAEKGGATGGLAAAFRDGGRLSRKLDGIVENKHDDNPRKKAEWKIAKHLEAAPERTHEESGNNDNPAG
jgi:hypothetical protein